MNLYDLNPQEQRKWAAARLFKYVRDYVWPYHPYLRRKYKEQGVDVNRLKAPDDLRRLPVIDKDDMRDDPQAFILRPSFPGVPMPDGYETERIGRGKLLKYVWQAATNRPREYSHLVRQPSFKDRIRRRALLEWSPIHFHASTGSTGNPTPATYTWYDLNHVASHLASLLVLPKARDPEEMYYDFSDRAMSIMPGAPHLAFYTPVIAKFVAGTSSFETFGGSVIPTERQISLFAQGGFSSLVAIPSYLVYWLRKAVELREQGEIEPLSNFCRAVLGGEPVSEPLRETLRDLALKAGAHPKFAIYQSLGMTEMKWAFLECCERSGIHLNPRYFYWELLHPETREPVAEGEPGVLVFSHIDWRGTVLIRYWTGDLVKGGMSWQRCEHCGWTFPRVYPPICRAVKDFTKLKGTRVDLSLLIESIRDAQGVRQFQILLENEDSQTDFSRDMLVVHVLAEPGHSPPNIEEAIRHRVKAYTEVTPDRIVFEDDGPEFEKRLFARTGIKADYIVEQRKLHV